MIVYFTDEDLKPERAHFDDAGVDLKTSEDIELPPKELKVVRTGVKAEIPFGFVGLLKDRSGLASKGIMSLGGVIDSGYRGEIKALLINTGDETVRFQRGDRVIQLITARIDTTVYYHKGEPGDETDRGENGFGSSGLRNGKYSLGEERLMGANEYNFDGYKFEVEDIVYVKDLVLKKRDFTQFLISGMAVLPNPSWSGDSYGGEWEAYIIRNRESDFIVVSESDLLSPNEAIKIFLSQSGISDEDIEWVSSGLQLNKRVKSWGSLTTK